MSTNYVDGKWIEQFGEPSEEMLPLRRELVGKVQDVVRRAGLSDLSGAYWQYLAEEARAVWAFEAPEFTEAEARELVPTFFMTPQQLGYNDWHPDDIEDYQRRMDALAETVYSTVKAVVSAAEADHGMVRVDDGALMTPDDAVHHLRDRLARWVSDAQTEQEQAAQEQRPITIYTTPHCMGCEMTRRQLDRAGVAYEAVDLSDRPDLVERFRGEGLTSAPVIETPDGRRSAGFDPSRIRAMVSAAWAPASTASRTPSSSRPPSAARGSVVSDRRRGASL